MSAPTTDTTDFDAEDGVFTATAVIDNGALGSRTVTFETGRLAKQAAGSVVATMGDTTLLSATPARPPARVGPPGRPPAQGPVRLLPPDGRRRGADVRDREDPRLVLPP